MSMPGLGDTEAVRVSRGLSRPPGTEVRVDPDSSLLLVAFSGLRPAQGDHYDFRRTSDAIAASRILVRDHERCWYHRGVRGVGASPESVMSYLTQMISSIKPSRIVLTGASAGGYAAILFGELLGVNEVHAFAPQTFVGLDAMRRFREPRWYAEARRMRDEDILRADLADLGAVLRARRTLHRPAHHVWFDPSSKTDSVHVAHVRDEVRVTLHGIREGGHEVAEALSGRGDLDRILEGALRSDRLPPITHEAGAFRLPRKVPRSEVARRRMRIARNRLMVRLGLEAVQYH